MRRGSSTRILPLVKLLHLRWVEGVVISTFQEWIILLRWLSLALLPNEVLQLLNSSLSHFNDLFGVLMYPIVGIKFLLQLYYRLISFIQSASKCDHYIPLFQEQLLIPINLRLFLLNLCPLSFHFLQFLLILLPYQLLLLFKQCPELWSFLNLFSSNKHLGVECPYLLFQPLLLFFLLNELAISLLQSIYSSCLVLLCSSLFFLKL